MTKIIAALILSMIMTILFLGLLVFSGILAAWPSIVYAIVLYLIILVIIMTFFK